MLELVALQLHSSGLREVMKSAPIQAECKKHAEDVKNRAQGGPYEIVTRQGRARAYARVQTKATAKNNHPDAYYREMKKNYLLKALGGK